MQWLLAALVLLAGTAVSFAAANVVARDTTRSSHQALTVSAGDMAWDVKSQLGREEDLVVSTEAFLSQDPSLTPADFASWAKRVDLGRRYPEVVTLGYVEYVPAADLAAFEAEVNPARAGDRADNYGITPAGTRPFYCLNAAVVQGSGQLAAPQTQQDYCAGAYGAMDLRARDSGDSTSAAVPVDGVEELVVGRPVYSTRQTPATVAARRADFLGYIGTSLNPAVVLDGALSSHPGLGMTVSVDTGANHATFSVGRIAAGEDSVVQNLGSGWTLRIYGPASSGWLGAGGAAILVLAVGVALSLAIAALLLLVSASRARALRLVDQRTSELQYQALHDSLTGLANRALLVDRLEQLVGAARTDGRRPAALYLDLDGFKGVNDNLGHGAGDLLLRAVADRLRGAAPGADTVARLGGDEFVVLLDTGGEAAAVAGRIVEALGQPFQLPGFQSPVAVSVSVGVAVGAPEIASELLRDADAALYHAKSRGKNRLELFHPELETGQRRRFVIDSDLRSALARHEFRVVYQPIYDLRDLELVGFEALLRWDHPVLGSVMPDEFIPRLEAGGGIAEVGRFVLSTACRQIAAWRSDHPHLTVAVNLSSRQLDDDAIIDDVRAALDDSGLDATAVTLEITESTLMADVDSTVRRLKALKAIGVVIAIDDFGTGYSSLAYVQQFPVDCLKIDRTFTQSLSSSPDADVIVHSLVELGKNLGLRTIAEGIETMGQVDQLRNEQVDGAQGFLFSKPLPAEEIADRYLRVMAVPLPSGETDRRRREDEAR